MMNAQKAQAFAVFPQMLIKGTSLFNSRIAVVALSLVLAMSSAYAADIEKNCVPGTYGLDDGRIVDISPEDGDTIRWVTLTGERGALHPLQNNTWSSTFGWTDRPDGKTVSLDCAGRIGDHYGSAEITQPARSK